MSKPFHKIHLLFPILLIGIQITFQFYELNSVKDQLYFPQDEEGPLDKCVCDGSDSNFDMVDECCCKMNDVDDVNDRMLPILDKLMSTSFFRYYKLNLWRKCNLFPDDGMCALRTCAVNECDEKEFHDVCEEDENLPAFYFNDINRLDERIDQNDFEEWTDSGDYWTNDADPMSKYEEINYVDLQKNPERYTGYSGHPANRIWRTIYNENCFIEDASEIDNPFHFNKKCIEKRVFYRLISGLHTSITTHLSYDYLLNEEKNEWGKNIKVFDNAVASHPARVKNLYFTYLLVLRSISKIIEPMKEYHFKTKNEEEAKEIKEMIKELNEMILSCPGTFDEKLMFRGKDSVILKRQFKNHFKNISMILDCVSCEKCKLWGKLQINGIGTSLKILFENKKEIQLERIEIVALFNTLRRLSESIKWSREMSEDIQKEKEGAHFKRIEKEYTEEIKSEKEQMNGLNREKEQTNELHSNKDDKQKLFEKKQ